MLMKLVARCSLKSLVSVTYDGEETASKGAVFPKIRHCLILITPIFYFYRSPR